ncbi:helix-turn-helix domain-containing protein [Emcibacter sp.]|uniref:MarR family transcriptional regulator n=1 Tax=Emcibacter sp. TaxID=1979954 RepID=UPI002AA5F1A7|nr:helix-turn-helix domain-containing protein [Emcibacter sp.]
MPGIATRLNEVLGIIGPEQCLTIEEMSRQSNLTRHALQDGAQKLLSAGYVERIEAGCYRLTNKGKTAKVDDTTLTSGPKGPLTFSKKTSFDSFTARIWRAMRVSRKFTVPDLVMLAKQGNEKEPEAAAGKYIRRLYQAGYLQLLPRREKGTAPTSNGFKKYLLVRDDGELHPRYRPKTGKVYDPNTKKNYELEARP